MVIPRAEPALHPQEAPRAQHPVRAVPRPGRRARARDARPAAAHGRLLRLPQHERRGAGRRQGRRAPPATSRSRTGASSTTFSTGDARAAALAPQRRPHARLDRAPQDDRRRRQRLLRQLPHGRSTAPTATTARSARARSTPTTGSRCTRRRRGRTTRAARAATRSRRSAPTATGAPASRATRRAATGRRAAASTRRRRSGRPRRAARTTTRGRRCAT